MFVSKRDCSKYRWRSKTGPAKYGSPRTFRWAGNSSIRNRTGLSRKAPGRPSPAMIPPGAAARFEISIPFPPEAGDYEIYVSPHSAALAAGPTRAANHSCGFWCSAAEGDIQVLAQEITTVRSLRWRRIWAALPKTVRKPPQNHRSEPSPDPVHGAARYSGALSRVVWRRLLDRSESTVAHDDVFFRLRHRAADAALEQTRAAPVLRSIFSPGCCPGSRFRNPWGGRRP